MSRPLHAQGSRHFATPLIAALGGTETMPGPQTMQYFGRAVGSIVCMWVSLVGCEHRIIAQESYTIDVRTIEKADFVDDLRSGLAALGFSELEAVPMSDNVQEYRLAFDGDPVRVDLFTNNDGARWMVTCSESKAEFSMLGRKECQAVADLLHRLPGEVSRISGGG